MSASELFDLLETDIPSGRQSLKNNHENLQLLAQHCEDQYYQADDKSTALEQTKDYTTHSLASVAYQIHTLASNFLTLLDLQQNQLSGMESSINHLSQIVDIHKEKVARREIGVITTNRTSLRQVGAKNGILFPEQNERPVKYQRKPIDYSTLDDLGHGVKGPTTGLRGSRPSSIISQTSMHAPTTSPPTPPASRSGSVSGTPYGTLGRSQGSNPYRSVAPPVAPPSLPPNHPGGDTARQSLNGARERFETLYAPSVMGMIRSPPPVGMPRPMSDRTSGMAYRDSSVDTPLPPPLPADVEGLTQEALQSAVSPPPPPPPPDAGQAYAEYINEPPPPPPEFSDVPAPPEDPYMETGPQFTSQPSWMPASYLEKVVAIYDYKAEKADELTFSENALIYVIKKNEDDWWEGVMDGHTGLFPSNYVDSCI